MSIQGLGAQISRSNLTRRQHIQSLVGALAVAAASPAHAANQNVLYGQSTLPAAIRSRVIDNGNGL
jgi:hypothetical protein